MKYDRRVAGLLAIALTLTMIILGMRAFASTKAVMDQEATKVLELQK